VSDRTPAEKPRLKPGMAAAISHVPEGAELGVPDDVTLVVDSAVAGPTLHSGATSQ